MLFVLAIFEEVNMSSSRLKKQIRNKTMLIREALGGLICTDSNSVTHCHSCGGTFDFYKSLRNRSLERKIKYHRPGCLYPEAMKATYRIEKMLAEFEKTPRS